MSAVYFAKIGDYVKIGFSSHPYTRLKELASRSSRLVVPDDFDYDAPAELVLLIPFCRMRDERNLHLLFARHWVIGEWFRWSPAFAYQMRTMQFVTHAVRLKDLGRARRALGLTHWAHSKFAGQGMPTPDLLAELAADRQVSA